VGIVLSAGAPWSGLVTKMRRRPIRVSSRWDCLCSRICYGLQFMVQRARRQGAAGG